VERDVVQTPNAALKAGRFILRAWRPEDAAWYLSARDEEVFKWTTERRDLTVEEIRSAIERHLIEPKWVALAIARDDGTPVGNISLVPQADGLSAEASFWLAAEGRGAGAATGAHNALREWAFAQSGVEVVFLKIAPGNASSVGVAWRCGFREAAPDDERLRFERRRL
jgi:ribosomal-protein-alanine N-acetyltransferase